MENEGELFSHHIHRTGIKRDGELKNRDDLVLHRRRSVVLTNPTVVRREKERRAAKENAKLANDETSQ